MAIKNDYSAGRCNIGAAEIRRRRLGGWFGVGLFAAALAALIVTGAAPAWYLSLFLPAVAATTGFMQASARFCIYFGLRSRFNFAELGQAARVVDAEARSKDRRRAVRLLGQAALLAAAIALSAFAVAAAFSHIP
jgi:hypothetical protein